VGIHPLVFGSLTRASQVIVPIPLTSLADVRVISFLLRLACYAVGQARQLTFRTSGFDFPRISAPEVRSNGDIDAAATQCAARPRSG
jgi:hypothetical protein